MPCLPLYSGSISAVTQQLVNMIAEQLTRNLEAVGREAEVAEFQAYWDAKKKIIPPAEEIISVYNRLAQLAVQKAHGHVIDLFEELPEDKRSGIMYGAFDKLVSEADELGIQSRNLRNLVRWAIHNLRSYGRDDLGKLLDEKYSSNPKNPLLFSLINE